MTTNTTGMLRFVLGSQFVLESGDHRIITYRTSDKTIVRVSGKDTPLTGLTIGDHFNVDSTEDEQGYMTATEVVFETAGTPADRAAAAQTWDLPKLDPNVAVSKSASAPVRREPGDERPVLRRKNDDSSTDSSSAKPEADATPAASSNSNGSQPPSTQTSSTPSASRTSDTAPPDEPVDTRPTTTVRPPDPTRDADDNGPPVLRRGGPASQRQVQTASSSAAGPSAGTSSSSTNGAATTQSSSASRPSNRGPVFEETAPPAPVASNATRDVVPFEVDQVVEKAREAAESFAESLPNFYCQQLTTRYQSDHPKQGWDALDVVSADVTYENGQESYKNIKIGNKSVNKAMEDIEGTRSTGEFSTILEDLFSLSTGAVFRKNGQDTVKGRSTWVYKFDVPRERSHWRIMSPAQLYYPAYRGTVWIDKETSRVLRLEQETRNMPLLFPFDTVETAADYDFVRLSSPQQFLLPVDAEILSCVRGTTTCARNRIEFRNYRKFGAESNVTFSDKQP